MNTCCGTHVKNLSQIQSIAFIARPEKRKTGGASPITRVTFIAGNRILRSVHDWSERERQLTEILHTGGSDHVASASRMASESRSVQQKQRGLLRELAGFIAADLWRNNNKPKQDE